MKKYSILTITLTWFLFTSCTVNDKKYFLSQSYKNSQEYKDLKNQKLKTSEAMQRSTMRSYKVHGKKYYPQSVAIGDTFHGIASWYGPAFHAKLTSNGERYNMHALTAASKVLPMNTLVEVTNLANNKTIIVRINDRGPFVKSRIIDLSNAAAKTLDVIKHGTADVKLEVVGFNKKIANSTEEKQEKVIVNTYMIQVGSFSKVKGAKALRRKFNLILDVKYHTIIEQYWLNKEMYNRVFIKGFNSKEEAEDFIIKYKIKNHTVTAV